jgi:hypothetical protein
MGVLHVLSQPKREWQAKAPASELEIALLESQARADLSAEYLELLRFSNGGEGPLALPPLWFQLYAVKIASTFATLIGTFLKTFQPSCSSAATADLSPSHSTYVPGHLGLS